MRRLLPALLVLALAAAVVPAPGAVAQDDAGTGGDAPDSCSEAQNVTLGTAFEGTLDSEEGEPSDTDFYRVEVPEGKLLVVRYLLEDADQGHETELFTDACGHPGDTLWDFDGNVERRAVETEGHEAFRFGLAAHGTLNYTLETTLYEVPDPAVTDVRVDEDPLGPDEAGAPPEPDRWVGVSVANVAEGSFPDPFDVSATLDVEVRHENGDERDLGHVSFDPWQTQEHDVYVEWNTVGEAGNVTVEADVGWEVDADPGNNRGTEESTVLVGGSGVDLLNRDDEAGAAGAQARVYADNDRGADGAVGVLQAPSVGAGGEEGGPSEAGAGAATSGAFAYGSVEDRAYVVASGGLLAEAFVGAYTGPAWVGADVDFTDVDAFACTWEPLPQDCTFVMP